MRTIDLAIYADALAGESAEVTARIERARAGLRRASIEFEARRALPAVTVSVLERRGVLGTPAGSRRAAHTELAELQLELAALERARLWVETQLQAEQTVRRRRGEGTVVAD